MKKVILTIVVALVGFIGVAQEKADSPKRLKYVTTGPDGSVAMTIIDDTGKDNLKLESAKNFYRYEIIDPTTGEAVFASKNQGKECDIDKTKLTSGTYNLRLYTSNFVITSKIAINNTKKALPSLQPVGDVVASR